MRTGPHKYPFFHWATGLALCVALEGGFIVGFVVAWALKK